MNEFDALAAATSQMGLTASEPQLKKFIQFLDLLERWNRTYNLTAVRDRGEMLTHHVVDCLAVVGPLTRQLPVGIEGARCLDVGSGGGLPAVVIAVMRPDLMVVSVDAVGKKVSFVRQIALELGLHNLHAEHGRIENLPLTPFDIITARAFASLKDLVALTKPLLKSGACWMAMKGQSPDDEIAALDAGVEVFHVEPLHVPNLAAARCLVWMKPSQIA